MKMINANCNGLTIYRCFSPPLSDFIQKHDILPINRVRHPTGKTFDVYLLNNTLSAILREWTANNPNKKGVSLHE